MAHHQDASSLGRQVIQLPAFAATKGQRLFHIDVLAPEQGLLGELIMLRSRGRNHDRVDRILGYHAGKIRSGPHVVLLLHLLPRLISRLAYNFQAPEFVKHTNQVLAPISMSDYGNSW